MKVLLLKRSRIWHDAGEIVSVSPAEAGFLLSTGSAVEAPEKKKKAKPQETPEDALTASIETPENAGEPAEEKTAAVKDEKPAETPKAKTTKARK